MEKKIHMIIHVKVNINVTKKLPHDSSHKLLDVNQCILIEAITKSQSPNK
jgi:hypothetical protein